MKGVRILVIFLFVATAFAADLTAADALLRQRVIYVGHRAAEFEPFLKQHFAKVEVSSREDFKPTRGKDFDVVLLDWPQGGLRQEHFAERPLGKREDWSRPTVLLGSAGLNLAITWKLKGGSGCTCLAPIAYGLMTNHEIFKTPIAINVSATTSIATPEAFREELKTETCDVLPLVDHIRHFETVIRDYRPGWCSYYFEFADVPEAEFFCGGINEKTPRASAVWRQGNLLHFGFEQSPVELNETGRALLVNAIVYISKFSQDRPIDITPSVFGEEKIGESRRRAKLYLLNHPDWAVGVYADSTLASFKWRDPDIAKTWIEENGQWLHPGPTNLLEVDTEAKSLGVPFDAADFIPKMIAALRDDKTKSAAAAILSRYVPTGPGAKATSEAWDKWWPENSPYVFYSELGCYRWYIDPLAKKRGVPTSSLRGLARADAN